MLPRHFTPCAGPKTLLLQFRDGADPVEYTFRSDEEFTAFYKEHGAAGLKNGDNKLVRQLSQLKQGAVYALEYDKGESVKIKLERAVENVESMQKVVVEQVSVSKQRAAAKRRAACRAAR